MYIHSILVKGDGKYLGKVFTVLVLHQSVPQFLQRPSESGMLHFDFRVGFGWPSLCLGLFQNYNETFLVGGKVHANGFPLYNTTVAERALIGEVVRFLKCQIYHIG